MREILHTPTGTQGGTSSSNLGAPGCRSSERRLTQGGRVLKLERHDMAALT